MLEIRFRPLKYLTQVLKRPYFRILCHRALQLLWRRRVLFNMKQIIEIILWMEIEIFYLSLPKSKNNPMFSSNCPVTLECGHWLSQIQWLVKPDKLGG